MCKFPADVQWNQVLCERWSSQVCRCVLLWCRAAPCWASRGTTRSKEISSSRIQLIQTLNFYSPNLEIWFKYFHQEFLFQLDQVLCLHNTTEGYWLHLKPYFSNPIGSYSQLFSKTYRPSTCMSMMKGISLCGFGALLSVESFTKLTVPILTPPSHQTRCIRSYVATHDHFRGNWNFHIEREASQ